MGNPNAKVRLVEFASMTSPYSAEFDAEGTGALIDGYVRTGQVSFEFRNHVRDPFDVAASLLARCGATDRFFERTRSLFASQREWIGKLLELSEDELQALQNMEAGQQSLTIAERAGLLAWATEQGLETANATNCLKDGRAAERLMQMRGVVESAYPELSGLPSFAINGSLLSDGSWQTVEARLKDAL
jgi:protein-disulfide isomerase